MAVESTIFKHRSPHEFSDTDPSNLIISILHTLSNLFHNKTQKQPILRHLSIFLLCIKFQVNLAEVSLNRSGPTAKS